MIKIYVPESANFVGVGINLELTPYMNIFSQSASSLMPQGHFVIPY